MITKIYQTYFMVSEPYFTFPAPEIILKKKFIEILKKINTRFVRKNELFSCQKRRNKNSFNFFIYSFFILLATIFFGWQLILNPHDLLDSVIVYNHIIGRIYKGDIESINLSDCHYICASDCSLGSFWLFLAV